MNRRLPAVCDLSLPLMRDAGRHDYDRVVRDRRDLGSPPLGLLGAAVERG
jgi:hypothetical protein